MKKKLVILISGSGSNLQAFIDSCKAGQLHANICLVLSNVPDVKGLERARAASIPTAVIHHQDYETREFFEKALIECIEQHNADAVILAGFMRILTPLFVNHFIGRLFNIHPSLLPKYPGLNTHLRAIENGDSESGATVHFVVPELDAGPAILQARVPVTEGDDAQALAARVLKQEHIIYPQAVKWFCEGRLQMQGSQACLDGKPLPDTGLILDQ